MKTTDLIELAELENEDTELIPEIVSVEARLSFMGSVEQFSGILQSAVNITPVREIIPNTSFVNVEARDSTSTSKASVHVAATDGDLSVERVSDTMVVRLAGSALLPGKRLLEILKLAPEPAFRLDVFATTATVRSGRAVWTIQLPSGKGLPPLPDVDAIELHEVNRVELIKALDQTVSASAKSSARLSLTQVSVYNRVVVGCDGARLHRKPVLSLPKAFKTTIPSSFAEVLLREMRKTSAEDTVLFGSSSSTIVLRMGTDTFTGQRLTLEFPNVEHLMLEPSMLNSERLSFDVSEAVEAIKRVRVNADPDLATVVLAVRQIKGEWTLTIRAIDKTGNSSQESISAEYDGESGREIAVNHKYFLEFLSPLSSSTVTLRLGEDTKSKKAPIYVEEETFTGVLMPTSIAFVK